MRQKRKGAEGWDIPYTQVFELVAIGIIIYIAANFLFGIVTGCFGDAECMQAKEELERLKNDLNDICRGSDLTAGESGKVGTYEFGATHAVGAAHPNVLSAAQMRTSLDDLPGWDDLLEGRAPARSFTRDWTVRREVERCDSIEICVLLERGGECHTSTWESLESIMGEGHVWRAAPFGAEDHVYYTVPEAGTVNLVWTHFDRGGDSGEEESDNNQTSYVCIGTADQCNGLTEPVCGEVGCDYSPRASSCYGEPVENGCESLTDLVGQQHGTGRNADVYTEEEVEEMCVNAGCSWEQQDGGGG